ncbi:MAG TPA: beta-propeller domain-containing protein, partial [Micromonosporaceae bacterium]
TGSFQLVAFDSCDEALTNLRAAAKEVVGPYGFGGPMYAQEASVGGVPAPAAPGAVADSAKGSGSLGRNPTTPNYSGTNTHESGVDEPDLVKTDGRRIVTVSGGVLRMIDPASRRMTGLVDLADPRTGADQVRYQPANLLLAKDMALVLLNEQNLYADVGVVQGGGDALPPGAGMPKPAGPTDPNAMPISGPRLILVDLSGGAHVVSTFRTDGGLVDARQVGSTIRVVIRSNPRLNFPNLNQGDDEARTRANRDVIDKAGVDRWLPRVEVRTGSSVQQPKIGCEAINRPAQYTATSLLTVLTFDLGRSDLATAGLGDGQPTVLVADGDTVYSNGPSLYVASDQRWRIMPMLGRPVGGQVASQLPQQRTEIYQFDTAAAGRPSFVAGGSVPGYLINQYAMSDWDGHLRVATTTGEAWAGANGGVPSKSAVYTLVRRGKNLVETGRVEGLGKGERIYAVRFAGPVGYVVTFRQTDPLYTVDLTDPGKPVVRGELKIPGYSAYLHPAGAGRLIGIGQNANSQGRVSGTQVSLFDIADLSRPSRVANYTLTGASSEAEFDPHAFLYWPQDGLLVVPLQMPGGVPPSVGGGTEPGASGEGSSGTGGGAVGKPAAPPVPPDAPANGGSGSTAVAPDKMMPNLGALVLRMTGDKIVEVGFLRHPASSVDPGYPAQIRRSLMIDDTLWTVSDGGLLASDSTTLARLAWIPFS